MNLEFEFIKFPENITNYAKKIIDACYKVYVQRQAKQYEKGVIYHRFSYKWINYMSQTVTSEEGFVAIVKVDGQVAAFMKGYNNVRTESLEVPRLAINDEYYFYSPGVLLVNETMKWIYDQDDVSILDLCRGTEKY